MAYLDAILNTARTLMPNPTAAVNSVGKLPGVRPAATDLLHALWPLALVAASFALLYAHVIVKLVHDWATDDNASHGFLIVPLALYLAWERRGQLTRLERRPSVYGLLIVVGSLGVLAAGTLG